MNSRPHPISSPTSVCVFLILLLAGGCQPSDTDTANPADANEAAVTAIQLQATRFSDAYVRGAVEELLSIYTEDGVAAPGGTDFYVGRSEMQPLWTIPASDSVLRHKTTSESLVVDGDHAYDWGYYEGQSSRDGVELPPFSGKYVIVWEKGDDGVWRMAVDMWNSLPPPPTDG